ncbi:MAG: hypothetical protein E7461_06645 [Ruminococcaceae bacterium]|nr:hypothetical protein [Oscillospiraceae bacterium]
MKITVPTSGTYRIDTISSSGDPDFSITNATQRTPEVRATDDIDGENDRNATLTINLIAGDIYYLDAFRHACTEGYTLLMQRIQ